MSKQIIIIDSMEALAEQIVDAIQRRKGISMSQAVLSRLHPIEVPSDAGELVNEILDLCADGNCNMPSDLEKGKAKAAARITAYSRTVPTSFIRSIAKTYYDYNVPKNCGDADYEEWNDEECKIIAQQYGYHAE